MKASDLQPGDPVMGWMKLGYALRRERRADGTIFRQVPSKPTRFAKDDLQQFTGMVMSNDPVARVLRLEVSRMTSHTQAVEPSLFVEIHYLALKRLRAVSKYAHAPKPENPLHPTRQAIGTAFHAYRTTEEVDLT